MPAAIWPSSGPSLNGFIFAIRTMQADRSARSSYQRGAGIERSVVRSIPIGRIRATARSSIQSTREPVHAIAGATVCAPSCMIADALTKVVMIAGEGGDGVAEAISGECPFSSGVRGCLDYAGLARMPSALQLDYRFRWGLYAAFTVLFVTGAVWLIADALKESANGEFWQVVSADLLMVHGGAAMVTLVLLGALIPVHIQRAWRDRAESADRDNHGDIEHLTHRNRLRALLRRVRRASRLDKRRAYRCRIYLSRSACHPRIDRPAPVERGMQISRC